MRPAHPRPARRPLTIALLAAALLACLHGLLTPGPALGLPSALEASDNPTPGAPAASTQSPDTTQPLTLLDRGHTDVFALVPNGEGISLVVKEDVTTPGTPTFHNPARVVLGVAEAAKTDASAALPGIGESGYALPQSEDPELLWPGWDSSRIAGLSPSAIRLVLDDVEGPGRLLLWRSASFGAPSPVFDEGFYAAAPGLAIRQHSPSHEHANWLFTAPGRYSLVLHGEVATPSGLLVTEKAAYTFAVGARAIDEAGALSVTEQTMRTSGADRAPTGTDAADGTRPTPDSPSSTPAPSASSPRESAPAASPSTASPEECIATPVTASMGGTAVGGSHTIRANTHVHPNWVFTAPGTYKVSITQSTTLKSGRRVSASDILTFVVGGTGNADLGHFDIGTSAHEGGIAMLVKDDRTQPSRWVAPSSLVFGLGSAAEVTAPSGIEFIAKPGSRIWMISSSQVPSVPWVGANTMHPELLRRTSGEVTWTLNGVSGPGSLAVFESGNFGTAVGARWFGGTATGQTTTYVGRTADGQACELDAATVARLRAEGRSIDPSSAPGGLASTGASATEPLLLASLLAALGLAGPLLAHGRRS